MTPFPLGPAQSQSPPSPSPGGQGGPSPLQQAEQQHAGGQTEQQEYSYNDFVGDTAIVRSKLKSMAEKQPAFAQDANQLIDALVKGMQKVAQSSRQEAHPQPKLP